MKTQMFCVKLNVSAELLPTVLGIISPECELLSVEVSNTPPKALRRAKIRPSIARPNKCKETMLSAFKDKHSWVEREAMKRLFKENGLAETSVSPTVTVLLREGKIKLAGENNNLIGLA